MIQVNLKCLFSSIIIHTTFFWPILWAFLFWKMGGKSGIKWKHSGFSWFFYIYLYVVLDYNPQASHGPNVVEIIFFFLVVDLKSYGTLTLRGFKYQKMCNLWKSYTILRFTLSTDEHIHLQTKNFKIDYKFMAFCTFF